MSEYINKQLLNRAIEQFSLGQYKVSESICNKLLNENYKSGELYNLIANLKEIDGDIDSAIENLNYAINIQPDNQTYLTNISVFFRKKNNFDKAIEYLKKSININPEFHSSLYLIACFYRELGNNLEAEKFFKMALKVNSNDSKSMFFLGLISFEKNEVTNAKNYFMEAIKIDTKNTAIRFNIIAICFFENDYDNAEYHCRKILENEPNNIKAIKQLLTLIYLKSNVNEFKNIYKHYLDLCLIEANDINNLRQIYLDLVSPIFNMSFTEINNYRNFIVDIIDKNDNLSTEISLDLLDIEDLHPNIQLSYHGLDNKELKIKYYNLFKNCFNKMYEFVPNKSKDKIRIGFLVTKTHETIFITFMSNIINNLPNDLFDVYLICHESSWNNILKNSINENIKIIFTKQTLDESAQEILKYSLDILYHWEIGTGNENYFLPFYRLAPVQCTSIGWPDTTGIKTIDYFISSNLIETEHSDNYYTEKLIKFDRLPFMINNPSLELPVIYYKSVENFNLNKNKNIYLCCQNIRKIHPDFDILVEGILNRDHNGIVVFVRDKSKKLSELLKSRIINKYPHIEDRIVFLDELSYKGYLNLLSLVDVVLDTLYFGGANTSYEGFSMNAPIVTYPWTHERGRYTLGCYKQMGIEGLIANSFDEYINLSVRTANDKVFRKKIVQDISENKHKLFNDMNVINEYIKFFTSVIRKY